MTREKAVSATFWSGADVFLRQGLQFATSIVLARLLAPEVFGTIALLYLFIGIAGAFVDSGFSSALIQSRDVTLTDESTVFWFNVFAGVAVALLLWLSAGLIADFFGVEVLVPLTGLMAVNFLISSLGSVHATLLSKRLEFRPQLKAGGTATMVSAVVAIAMAYSGFGVWALAAQIVVASLVNTILLWTFNSWRPAFVFSLASAKRLFGFGGYLLASSLLETIYSRGYTLLLGRFYGVRELGFFHRADVTKQVPVGVLTGILGRVAFPLFAAASDDKVRLRRGVQLGLRTMMLMNVPMMVGLSLVSVHVTSFLFGEAWMPSAPLIRILSWGAVLWPLQVININVLMAQGHSNLYFRLEVAKKVIGIITLVVGAFFGISGIAWSYVLFSIAAFWVNAFYTGRFLDYGALAQLRDVVPIGVACIPMTIAVLVCDAAVDTTPAIELGILVTLGAVSYFGAAALMPATGLREAVSLVLGRFRRGSQAA